MSRRVQVFLLTDEQTKLIVDALGLVGPQDAEDASMARDLARHLSNALAVGQDGQINRPDVLAALAEQEAETNRVPVGSVLKPEPVIRWDDSDPGSTSAQYPDEKRESWSTD